jgi:hypothetical protein
MQFRIEATDKYGAFFSQSFDITSVTSEYTSMHKTAIRIDFIDVTYSYFTNLHISKGYNNKSITDIVNDVLNIGPKMGITFKFSDTQKIYENMVIPGNRNFATFLNQREMLDGFSFITARHFSYILNPEDLKNMAKIPDMTRYRGKEGTKNIVFRDVSVDEGLEPYQIKSLKRLHADLFLTHATMPITIDYTFDYTNKGVKHDDNATAYNVTLSKKNHVADNQTQLFTAINPLGVKLVETYNANQLPRFSTFKLLENSKYEIITDGTFNLDIMQVVGLVITKKVQYQTILDVMSSGFYYVIKIVDKIQGNNFSQIVTLGRAGFANGVSGKIKESNYGT